MTSATAINAVPVLEKSAEAQPGVELSAQFDTTRENSPGSDTIIVVKLTVLSCEDCPS